MNNTKHAAAGNTATKTKQSLPKVLRDYACIIALALLMAINFEIFIFRNSFAPSGINGVATMIQYVFDVNVGYISLIINIPLVVAAFFLVDRKFALR
ncbi:MAG: YitT family protein [Clostridia bacterium]|nr:YitT family protein [Clostridia bacterium]